MADATTRTPEEIAAEQAVKEAQARFLDSLGLSAGDIAQAVAAGDIPRSLEITRDLATVVSEAAEGKNDRLREIIAAKPPEELLTAFEAASPAAAPFLNAIRNNPALAESVRDLVANDPSALERIPELANANGSMTEQEIIAVLSDQSVSTSLTGLFAKVAQDPNDAYTFDTVTGIMHKLSTGDIEGANAELAAMEVSEIELSGSLVTAVMTPDELLAEIGERAGIEIPASAMADTAFKQALFDAVKNDPTVLEGMMALNQPGTSDAAGFAPADLQTMLADDRNRGVFTDVLNAVATNPNGEDFNFQDMTDLSTAIKNGDFKLMAEKFRRMGIDMPEPTTEELVRMLGNYMNDPVGFSGNIVEMMQIDPNSAQGQAMTQLLQTMGGFIEMVIGGETGYRAFAQHYAPQLFNGGMQFVNDISGETDAQRVEAENAEVLARGQGPIRVDTSGLEGNSTNVTSLIDLKQSYIFGLARPYEAGLPQPDAPAQPPRSPVFLDTTVTDEQRMEEFRRSRILNDSGVGSAQFGL